MQCNTTKASRVCCFRNYRCLYFAILNCFFAFVNNFLNVMFMSHWLEISYLVNKKLDMRYAFYEGFIFLFTVIIHLTVTELDIYWLLTLAYCLLVTLISFCFTLFPNYSEPYLIIITGMKNNFQLDLFLKRRERPSITECFHPPSWFLVTWYMWHHQTRRMQTWKSFISMYCDRTSFGNTQDTRLLM